MVGGSTVPFRVCGVLPVSEVMSFYNNGGARRPRGQTSRKKHVKDGVGSCVVVIETKVGASVTRK